MSVSLAQRLRDALPRGQTLPDSIWRARHRWILILVWLQAVLLVGFAVWMGEGLEHGLFEASIIALAGLVAAVGTLPKRMRAAASSVGLVTASAVMVHLSGGYIEAHFHFFVMMGVIVLYEDWIPFLLSIVYVAVHHGIVGWLDPMSVYNHPAALAQPWLWAGIHAAFILAMCSALVIYWRSTEEARRATQVVLDSAGEGILGLDGSARVTFANPAACHLAGRSEADLTGLPLPALFPGLRASPAVQRGEADLRRPGGLIVPVAWTWTPTRGETEGSVLTFQDITARHAAEVETQEMVSLLTATLESTADGILVVDRRGRVTRSNARFREMWHIPPDAAASRDDAYLLSIVVDQLEDAQGFVAKVKTLYAEPNAESFDVLHFKDGRVFERYSRPQRIAGEVVGRVWSFRDVTERVHAEQERRLEEEREREAQEREKEIERLQELDRFKNDFINTTAHELRTPLTPIKVHLNLLARSHPGLGGRNLEVLKRNVARLEGLIEDELQIVRLRRGRLELKTTDIDMTALLREVQRTFEGPAREAGVKLTLDAPAGVTVHGDVRRLHQVLDNLVSNAIKFTPDGGSIAVRARCDETMCTIEVADSGRGLREDQLAQLFQPFARLHEDDPTAPSGTGLGLYISRSIIELHGGRVWCASAGAGKGATFFVEVPRAGPPVTGSTSGKTA